MPKNYFTLFYCEKHCSGCVISGNHNDVPEWHQMCGDASICGDASSDASMCDWSWWIKNGLIAFDKESGVEVIESPIDFSMRDCGGFEFAYYAKSITSELGDLVADLQLIKWFENYRRPEQPIQAADPSNRPKPPTQAADPSNRP